MKIKLTKPIKWEEETYSEINLDLERLTGADSLEVSRELRRTYPKEPVFNAETDDRYLVAIAARAARVPVELLHALPMQAFVRVKTETQGFLLGADSGESPTES